MTVKFKQIKKRKILETWQHKNRKTGLVSLIFHSPTYNYYFAISCFEKKCGLEKCAKGQSKCDQIVYYNSLDDGVMYASFCEVKDAIEEWHRVWAR